VSAQTQAQASTPALPDFQTAYNTLFTNVSAEVFFSKLASAGIAPADQIQAQELLDLASRLRTIEEDPRYQKQAAAANPSPFGKMIAELDGYMSANGMNGRTKAAATQEHAVAVKQAAASLAQNPLLYNSILTIKAAQATQYQQPAARA